MTRADAEEFFGLFFNGKHHIPGKITPYGEGWQTHTQAGQELSTIDYATLTRLVVLAHDRAVRVTLKAHNVGRIKIIIHQRLREGDDMVAHPTLEENVARQRAFTEKLINK